MLLSTEELGGRIAAHRKRQRTTQADLAKAVGCGRTTLVAIEKGERRPTNDELLALTKFLGVSLHELLSPHSVQGGVSARFRMPRTGARPDDGELSNAVARLEALGKRYAELERIMGIPPTPSRLRALMLNTQVRALSRAQAAALGQDAAARVRGVLGVSDSPIPDPNNLLEYELSLRVFYLRDLPSRVAALMVYGEDIGICIGVNAHHPPGRRAWALAHEIGHAIDDPEAGDLLPVAAEYSSDPAEHFADGFAKAFLLPATGISRIFGDRRRTNGDRFTPLDIAHIAKQFGVSFEAMTRRLEELALLRPGTYDYIAQSGLKTKSLEPLAGSVELPQLFPERYRMLLVDAFLKELISEGELAAFLETDRVSARDIYQQMTAALSMTESGVTLPLDLELVATE